jgi:Holliday junction resolvasome RuvABC DNA-binding subunit
MLLCAAGEMMQAALEAGVAQLMEMGYSRSKAADALQECHCDVELAVEHLATTCC